MKHDNPGKEEMGRIAYEEQKAERCSSNIVDLSAGADDYRPGLYRQDCSVELVIMIGLSCLN